MDVTATRLRRAMVTGASAGIGEEFARQLAARGLELVVVARRADRLHALATALRRSHGCEVEILAADLTKPADVARVADRLDDLEAPIDVLVNNAGLGLYGAFAALDRARVQHLLDLNISALVTLTHAVLPRLIDRQRGGVINVASTASFQPNPMGAVYGASKAFVRSFTEALHEEVGPHGVRMLALCPGYTETEYQQVAQVREGAVPAWASPSAVDVVTSALDAFTHDKAVVVPGIANRVMAAGSQHGPSTISRKISAMVHGTWLDEG